MCPDLYAAYLHGASQWDGDYQPIAQNDVAVYIFMAENDEYYGSAKARSAYEGLQRAWREKGYTDEQISELLKFPTTNTLTAAEFTTTTAEEISFSIKHFELDSC